MASYPPEWETDVVLADGATLHLRPIRPEDHDALNALFGRLSAETIQFRFFTPLKELSETWLTRLTTIDYDDRMALVGVLEGDLVAVGRYDRLDDPRRAEVAFTVEDAHQGRGIGTLLLEHLALAARERGIDTFCASVLTGNRRMLDVFHGTAFPVTQHFDGGAIQLEFPITPTEAALAAQEARERVAESRSMARLLAPRSIAVVGAGRRRGTIGHEIFRNLITGDFEGPVYPVNATAHSVAAVRAYPSTCSRWSTTAPAARSTASWSSPPGSPSSTAARASSTRWSSGPAAPACGSSAPTAWGWSTPPPTCA